MVRGGLTGSQAPDVHDTPGAERHREQRFAGRRNRIFGVLSSSHTPYNLGLFVSAIKSGSGGATSTRAAFSGGEVPKLPRQDPGHSTLCGTTGRFSHASQPEFVDHANEYLRDYTAVEFFDV